MGLFSVQKLFGMTLRESADDGSDFTNPDADYRRIFLGEDGHLHAKDSSGTVTDLSSAPFTNLDIPTSTSPSQTADGRAVWDSDDDKLTIGTGAARKTLVNEGAVTSSGLTMSTARLLGRTTSSTGAVEEISVGSGLSLSAGSLSASGGASLAGTSYLRSGGDYTTTSDSFADVDGTNLALTITTGAHRVLCGFSGSAYNSGTNATAFTVAVDGTDQGDSTFGIIFLKQLTAAENMNASFTFMTAALTAGSHTFKLRWRRVTAGTSTISGSSPQAQFWVAEMPF